MSAPHSSKDGGGRRRIRVRSILVGATAITSSLALAACGAGSSSNTGSTHAKTYVVALPALPLTLDASKFDAGTRPFYTLMDTELFNYQSNGCAAPLTASKLVGQLVKSWTKSPDGKSYDIVLNNDKSEYGNQLTAQDVQWSLARGLALSPIVKFLSSNSAHFAKNAITVVSPSEFKLNVDSATPVDLAMWTVPSFAIYDSVEAKKHATAADPWASAWIATHSDGFGPWKVVSFDQGNQITLAENTGYTGSRGNISKVIIKQVAGGSDQAQLLQSGAINYASSLTYPQYKSLSTDSKVTINACSSLSRDVMILNLKDPDLAKPAVRKAISMAINRDQLVTGAYAGFGKAAVTGLLPGEMPASSTVPTLTNDVAGAKALLASAGYPNGFKLDLQFTEAEPGSQVLQSSILLQSQLKQIGITVTLDHKANGQDFDANFHGGKFQSILYYSGSALPDAYFDAGLEEPGSPNDTWGYANQKWVSLVNQLGSSTAGTPSYDAAATQLATLNVTEFPWIPLVDTPNIFATTSNVTDVDAGMRTGTIIPQPAVMNIK